MERRVALKNIAFIVGSAIALPVWAKGIGQLTPGAEVKIVDNPLLTSVVDTIIPATKTPGAKALGVPALVQKILTDCYEKDVVDSFYNGMTWVDEKANTDNGKPFTACTTEQKLAIFKQVQAENVESDQYKFVKMAKELTILGYTSSKYYVTNISKYIMMPGHYYGNVPVNFNGIKHAKA